jgi:hypothetical protein
LTLQCLLKVDSARLSLAEPGWLALIALRNSLGPAKHSVFLRNNAFRKTETHATVNFVMTTMTDSPRATRARRTSPGGRSIVHFYYDQSVGGGQKRKKALGGRRSPLKRLDSEKENQGFFFDFLWLGLAGFGQISPDLGVAWKNQIGWCAAPRRRRDRMGRRLNGQRDKRRDGFPDSLLRVTDYGA